MQGGIRPVVIVPTGEDGSLTKNRNALAAQRAKLVVRFSCAEPHPGFEMKYMWQIMSAMIEQLSGLTEQQREALREKCRAKIYGELTG